MNQGKADIATGKTSEAQAVDRIQEPIVQPQNSNNKGKG